MRSNSRSAAECPDCGDMISFRDKAYVGQTKICPHCDAELVVVDLHPLVLDFFYDDEDSYDDYDDEYNDSEYDDKAERENW